MPLIVALLVALLPTATQAQTLLRGVVVDAGSSQPLAGVEVRLLTPAEQLVQSTLAGDDGQFSLTLDEGGAFRLRVSRVGYAVTRVDSLVLESGTQTELEIRMGVDAVPLEPVVVVASGMFEPHWIEEFRERAELNQRLGRGRIYTREEIERVRPFRATDLLAATPLRNACQPLVLLDGLPAGEMLRSVRGEELEGVEVYRNPAEIPLQYYQSGMCGLVMFWRRADPPDAAPLSWARVGVAAAVLLLLGVSAAAF